MDPSGLEEGVGSRMENEEEEEMERVLKENDIAEYTETMDNDGDDDLPPILEPPSSGYTHNIDENQPPPQLHPINFEQGQAEDFIVCDMHGNEYFSNSRQYANGEDDNISLSMEEVIDVEDDVRSDTSSNTDSDDDLVDVDYLNHPPATYKELLARYSFLAAKENWIYNVRTFYKGLPTQMRRLLKLHKDAEGNPVEEPLEMLFEKINAEKERIRKAQNIKPEEPEEKDDEKEEKPSTVVSVKVEKTEPRLVHVAYPGNVVNNGKAIATLGGAGAISKIFDQPNKKLQLRFRPNDPYANGVNGQGRTACGLLLRVRRRKNPKGATTTTTDARNGTSHEQEQPVVREFLPGESAVSGDLIQDMLLDNQLVQVQSNRDESISFGERVFQPKEMMLLDQSVVEEVTRRDRITKAWATGRSKDFNLKVPKVIETTRDMCSVETIGIVHRSYEFNGICDFQYLPVSKTSNGSLASVKDKIFPIFGSSENPEKLVMKELINEETLCQTFSLPPAMSRIDNPPRGLIEELILSEKSDSAHKKAPPDDSVFSSRRKRIIFTISYNFQADAKNPDTQVEVPSRPLDLAVEDVERRQIKKEFVEIVRSKFEERPIWSKAALACATKIASQILKYIIPTFAYFAANGPWRNTWIKFGVDPRKNPMNVLFQAVDFRVPFIYRRFMNIKTYNSEANHKFHPEYMPPKTQMFYQLCDIMLDEIKELIVTLKRKGETGQLVYDDKFGFLKEGTYEYFRYILTHYLENLLQEHGKIPASTSSGITIGIPVGQIEPTNKMKAAPHRRVKVKRIRKSSKKVVDPSVAPNHGRGGSKGKGKKTAPSSTNSYQHTLEDLALNDLQDDVENDEDEYFEDDYVDE